MLLWVSFAVLSAFVLAALLRPLLRPAAQESSDEANRAVYRDQVAEIDADRAAGLIGEAEAEAAKRELARRLLAEAAKSPPAAAGAGGATASTATGLGRYPAFIVGISLIPALGLLLYQGMGSPRLPGQPHEARVAAKVERNSVDELVARVEARLREHPEDGAGWDVLAPVYLRYDRYREAADAFGNAIRILGPNVKRLTGFAGATVISNNGVVSEDARKAYEQVLKLEPGHVEAQFWLAMAKEQDGALKEAAADYRALLAAAPPNAPWRSALEDRLSVVNERLGASGQGSASGKGAAPSAEGAKAMEALPPEERLKAIGGMVDGLAARLKQDGSDLDGWLRLVRAYKVLGRHEAAAGALADARRAMQGNSAALNALETLAKDLGMGT
jgi:cytochrome c-type biogenesis protein CcmH